MLKERVEVRKRRAGKVITAYIYVTLPENKEDVITLLNNNAVFITKCLRESIKLYCKNVKRSQM